MLAFLLFPMCEVKVETNSLGGECKISGCMSTLLISPLSRSSGPGRVWIQESTKTQRYTVHKSTEKFQHYHLSPFCLKFYVQVLSVNLKLADAQLCSQQDRQMCSCRSSEGTHRSLTIVLWDRTVLVFHSTANISIFFFAGEREQRQKGVNADLCSLNRSQEACQERVDMPLLSLYFSWLVTGASGS